MNQIFNFLLQHLFNVSGKKLELFNLNSYDLLLDLQWIIVISLFCLLKSPFFKASWKRILQVSKYSAFLFNVNWYNRKNIVKKYVVQTYVLHAIFPKFVQFWCKSFAKWIRLISTSTKPKSKQPKFCTLQMCQNNIIVWTVSARFNNLNDYWIIL